MTLDDFEDGDYEGQDEPEKKEFKAIIPIQVNLNEGAGVPEYLDTAIGMVEVGHIKGTIPFETSFKEFIEADARKRAWKFGEVKADEIEEEMEEKGINGRAYIESELVEVTEKQ